MSEVSRPDFNGWSVTLAGVDLYGVISAIEAISYEDDEELADTLISIRAYLLEAEEAIGEAMQIMHRAQIKA